MTSIVARHLAGLSQDDLERMREDIERTRVRLETELRAVTLEDQLVAAAQGSRQRRSTTSASAGRVQINRDQVVDILQRRLSGKRINSGDLSRAFASEGITVSTNAAKQHLRRLDRAGLVGRDGTWFVVPAYKETSGDAELIGAAAHTSSNGVHPDEDREQG